MCSINQKGYGWLLTPRLTLCAVGYDTYRDKGRIKFDLTSMVDERERLDVRLLENCIDFDALNGLHVP